MKYDRIWGTQVEVKAAASLSLFQTDLYYGIFTNCLDSLAGPDSTGSRVSMDEILAPRCRESIVFPPEEEWPRSLDTIHYFELSCHSSCHFDCVVDSTGKLPLEAPSLQGLIQADVVLVQLTVVITVGPILSLIQQPSDSTYDEHVTSALRLLWI